MLRFNQVDENSKYIRILINFQLKDISKKNYSFDNMLYNKCLICNVKRARLKIILAKM